MKKIIFTLLLTMFASVVVYSQAGIYLFLPTITSGAGSAGVHADESLISSTSYGSAVTITQSVGGNPGVSQPTFSDVSVTKSFDKSSLRLQNLLVRGTQSPFAEIRFYNTQNVLLYSVRLEGVYVGTQAASASDGCPNGCQSISESYSLVPTSKVIQTNFAETPNQVLTYDIKQNKTTFTQ